jgi:transcriptional regulator with XRE-family HTH domain
MKGWQSMKYNYSKLLGRIRECGLTQEQLAKAIGKNKSTISTKLNGRYPFTTKEIDDICRVLNISNDEIGTYFFAV